jgi:two-component system CheB/CheR fusion protein
MTDPVASNALEALGLETLSEVLERAPDASTLSRAVRDVDGHAIDMTLLWMNVAARRGQPDPRAAIGRTCRELWPQMVANGSLAACMRVLDSGVGESGEFDWTERQAYARGYYSWTATRVGADLLLWTLRDAGPRFLRALETEVRLQGILTAAPDPIIVIDEEGRVTLANAACAALLGWAPDELVGHSLDVLLPGGQDGGHVPWLRRYAETGERRVIGVGRDVQARHRDGRLVPVRLSVSETTLFGHRVFTGILHDLTARQQLEAQLRHVQKMEVVGRLVSSVVHDFNNLLTVMSAASALLEAHIETSTGRELVRELIDASDRGAALTQQLLSRARHRPTIIEPIDVATVLRRLEPSAARLAGRDVTLRLELESDGAPVRAEVGAIEQAILNLVINARDAMPDGGTLVIAAGIRHVPGEGAPVGLLSGPWMRISVRDSGTGMPPDVRARALEPFFTTKPEGLGTGLGLSSVHDLVRGLGGHMEIDSALDAGTTVTLWLPCEPAATTRPAPRITDARGSETVVLVDDDDAILRLMEQALHAKGYDVHGASSAADARRLLAALPHVDVLVSDVVLPGSDGVALARELVAEYPTLRVLLVSGFGAGVVSPSLPPRTAFLAKPFTARELALSLQELVRSAAAR